MKQFIEETKERYLKLKKREKELEEQEKEYEDKTLLISVEFDKIYTTCESLKRMFFRKDNELKRKKEKFITKKYRNHTIGILLSAGPADSAPGSRPPAPPDPPGAVWPPGWGRSAAVPFHRGQTGPHIPSNSPQPHTGPAVWRKAYALSYAVCASFVRSVSHILFFINKLGLSFWKWVCYNCTRIAMPI